MNENYPDRIIGEYYGPQKGPMLICVGGVHGNEPAGVRALELLLKMVEVEPITNPAFRFNGSIIGLRGNLQALNIGERFIRRDLNRSLVYEHVNAILDSDPSTLEAEDKEIFELVSTIRKKIDDYQPDKVVVLDLHTTTAFGGIFVLASSNPESIRIGIEMHAPVITGFETNVTGTTMDYFRTEHFDREVIPIVFESGQHTEPLSVNRAIAAIINVMRTIGNVHSEDVENRHDHLLIEYSKHLPKVAELVGRYHVEDTNGFQMLPDFKNFQTIRKGEVLAILNGEEVKAGADGMLLMPKYQKQGQDGFFIIRPVAGY